MPGAHFVRSCPLAHLPKGCLFGSTRQARAGLGGKEPYEREHWEGKSATGRVWNCGCGHRKRERSPGSLLAFLAINRFLFTVSSSSSSLRVMTRLTNHDKLQKSLRKATLLCRKHEQFNSNCQAKISRIDTILSLIPDSTSGGGPTDSH